MPINFENIKKLGEGNQGIVWLSKDIRLGRKVAIKSLHNRHTDNEDQKSRFIGEAKKLSKCNHVNIVTLYDYIDDSAGLHLVMEYIPNSIPLDEYIEKNDGSGSGSGPIQELRAINIFIQVLRGISYIHKKNIIHRDIKPSNIMLDKDENVKLLDFGIAKDSDVDAKLTIVSKGPGGTPMYMSPEHVAARTINEKSDIYSLGVTLWQMLTGVAPYHGVPVNLIYNKILTEDLKDVRDVYPHVSEIMNNIIQKATKKDPEDRYDSCDSFIRALEDLKEYLLSDKDIEDVSVFRNIDVKVLNVQDANIVINTAGCIGTELTYTGLPGKKVEITIQKEGYNRYYRKLILNQKHRKIPVVLQKKSSMFFTFLIVLLLIVIFCIFIYFLTLK